MCRVTCLKNLDRVGCLSWSGTQLDSPGCRSFCLRVFMILASPSKIVFWKRSKVFRGFSQSVQDSILEEATTLKLQAFPFNRLHSFANNPCSWCSHPRANKSSRVLHMTEENYMYMWQYRIGGIKYAVWTWFAILTVRILGMLICPSVREADT